MSYLETGNSFITVNGNRIAYRELSKGKSEIPLVMLVHLAANMDNWDPKLILVSTGSRGGKGIKNIIGITFKYIFKAVLEKTDPKRFIFYNHDEKGKIEAEKVLGRLSERNEKYSDKATTVPSFLRQLIAIRKWGKEKADDLSFINQPTLIVNGDNDLMVATENSYDMHNRIANSKLVIYPNSGHGSLFQFPEKFSDEVNNFLK